MPRGTEYAKARYRQGFQDGKKGLSQKTFHPSDLYADSYRAGWTEGRKRWQPVSQPFNLGP